MESDDTEVNREGMFDQLASSVKQTVGNSKEPSWAVPH